MKKTKIQMKERKSKEEKYDKKKGDLGEVVKN